MSSSERGFGYWLNAWIPVALALVFIALESTPYLGSDHTSHPFRWVYEAIFGCVSSARWEVIHYYIRKTGHFLGYGAVGLTWLRAWWMTLPRSRFLLDASLAMLATAAVASADEFHQTLLSNRTGSAWDVLLDCCGAIALQLLAYLFMRICRPKRLMRAA